MRRLTLPQFVYGPYDGQYGSFYNKRSNDVNWHSCRESYHNTFPKSKIIFFVTADPNKVISFIGLAEDILNLTKKERCKFIETTYKNIIGISVGNFWGNKRRKTLLTILLRASQHVSWSGRKTKKLFWEVCAKERYLSLTWRNFVKFMRGYTDIKGSYFDGWVSDFAYDDYHSTIKLVESKDDKRRKRSLKRKSLKRKGYNAC